MEAYPNNKPWAVDLVGFYERGDWYSTGGVILWDDGTVWVYSGESPIYGDAYWTPYPSGFSILERKPGSDFWERLLPDTWGDPVWVNPQSSYYKPVPGYPGWFPEQRYTMDVQTSIRTAPLNVARMGGMTSGEPAPWHLPPNGDEVIFMENNYDANTIFPIAINKTTRQWRVVWDEDRAIGENTRIWWNSARASNVVLYEGYYWFLAHQWVPYPGSNNFGVPYLATINYDGTKQLVRAPVDDIQDLRVIHIFPPYAPELLQGHITTDIDIPEFINNLTVAGSTWGSYGSDFQIVMGDGMFYIFDDITIEDSRTSPSSIMDEPGAVNHDMKVGFISQTAIGDWENLKVVYYHHNQGWVGYSRPVGGTGSSYGTTSGGSIGSFQDSEGYGSGFNFVESWAYSATYREGFIYFWTFTGRGGVFWNQVGGSPALLCRMDVSGLDPEAPRAYERDNPYYEVIGNGTFDWEGGTSRRWPDYGDHLVMRYGSQALYPYVDYGLGIQFDNEGAIWLTGFQYVQYIPDGGWGSGYPWKVLLRVRPPDNETRVTLTFTGTAYQGYTAVRETGSRTREIELELGSVQPV